MRVLIVGAAGQVGVELTRAAWPEGTFVGGVDVDTVDITRAADIARVVRESRADAVVNVAAYTAVDKAESEPATARAVNDDGARHVAAAAHAIGAVCVHFSTDYVFDGTKTGAYVERDPVAPASVYGATKEAGERAVRAACGRHIVFRTSWVYGVHGQNFVKTMLRLQREREVLRVVGDQHGCPSEASELAEAVVRICAIATRPAFEAFGTYHVAGLGETTWHGLATEVIACGVAHGRPARRVDAITTAEYPTPARRPANSVLDCTRAVETFGIVRRPWRASVARVVDAIVRADAG
jgi:dTDP-4-dehydrorhamnose reductase